MRVLLNVSMRMTRRLDVKEFKQKMLWLSVEMGSLFQWVSKFVWLPLANIEFILEICLNNFYHIAILCIVAGILLFFRVLIFHLYFSHKSKMYFIEVECILQCLQGRRKEKST